MYVYVLIWDNLYTFDLDNTQINGWRWWGEIERDRDGGSSGSSERGGGWGCSEMVAENCNWSCWPAVMGVGG